MISMNQLKIVNSQNNKTILQSYAYLVCDNCGAYPLEPQHGHYVCPRAVNCQLNAVRVPH